MNGEEKGAPRIAIVGLGTMGCGIAETALSHGCSLTVIDWGAALLE
jgi:3-hydroxyisobutyrate dehydrogenase-like beta-hydroxyacid dehydrogenase